MKNSQHVERPFEASEPLKKKHFWPVLELFACSLRSVGVFLKRFEVSSDALVKRLHTY